MLRRQAVIQYEGGGTGALRNVADKLLERLRASPVEPATVKVKDGLAGTRAIGCAPPTGNISYGVRTIGHAVGRSYALDDTVVRCTRANAPQTPFVGFHHGPHGCHRSPVMGTDWVPEEVLVVVLSALAFGCRHEDLQADAPISHLICET